MGVQEVVARLSKSRSSLRKSPKAPVPPLPSKKIVLPSLNDSRPPSPMPSPVSTVNNSSLDKSLFDIESDNNSVNGISSLLQKFEQPLMSQSKFPTPPESPIVALNEQKKPIKKLNMIQKFDEPSVVSRTVEELEEIFQTLVDQNNAAEEYIQSLQVKVEKYASDATKVRDYEIRVEYLVTKLEQVTEERDFFEEQLNQVSLQSNAPVANQKNNEISENVQEDMKPTEDVEMNDLLNVYEEMSTPDEELNSELYDEFSSNQIQQENIESLNDQLVEADKSVQMTLMKYVADLETQKLETKGLKEVVKKQDELISKLEKKIQIASENTEELLKEQVEVQRIELDNKRELLTQLLNEREGLMKRLSSPRSSFRMSSLEFISNRSSLRSSVSSLSGRGTPPLTAPPKQPLPPLPNLP